jgi:hypothetical protein
MIGLEAKPELEYIINNADNYDSTRDTILQTARALMQSFESLETQR